MKTTTTLGILAAAGAIALVTVACGADGTEGGVNPEDGGNIPVYDAGSDKIDGGETDDDSGTTTCTSTDTPDNCGACGNVCAGYFTDSGANVSCEGGTACSFSCSGERYDVNADASDGCETPDLPKGNHALLSGVSVGAFSCDDGDSKQDLKGEIVSDERTHEDPSITGFVPVSGSADDYFTIHADGGATCLNGLVFNMKLTGTTHGECYTLSVHSDKNDYTCTPAAGETSCGFDHSSSQYSGGTDINVKVSKTCSATSVHEVVVYEITGNL